MGLQNTEPEYYALVREALQMQLAASVVDTIRFFEDQRAGLRCLLDEMTNDDVIAGATHAEAQARDEGASPEYADQVRRIVGSFLMRVKAGPQPDNLYETEEKLVHALCEALLEYETGQEKKFSLEEMGSVLEGMLVAIEDTLQDSGECSKESIRLAIYRKYISDAAFRLKQKYNLVGQQQDELRRRIGIRLGFCDLG